LIVNLLLCASLIILNVPLELPLKKAINSLLYCFIINPRMLHTLGYDINPDGEPVHGICYTCRLNRERTEKLFGVTSQTINLVIV